NGELLEFSNEVATDCDLFWASPRSTAESYMVGGELATIASLLQRSTETIEAYGRMFESILVPVLRVNGVSGKKAEILEFYRERSASYRETAAEVLQKMQELAETDAVEERGILDNGIVSKQGETLPTEMTPGGSTAERETALREATAELEGMISLPGVK